MKNYDTTTAHLLKEQNYRCWHCGKYITTGHWHHGVIPKGHTCYRKFKKHMDMIENLALVCWQCDTQHGEMTGFDERNKLFSEKIDQGYDMFGWLEKMNMIIQDNFHYVKVEDR